MDNPHVAHGPKPHQKRNKAYQDESIERARISKSNETDKDGKDGKKAKENTATGRQRMPREKVRHDVVMQNLDGCGSERRRSFRDDLFYGNRATVDIFGQIDKMEPATDQAPLFIQIMPIAVNGLVVQIDRNSRMESPEAQRGQRKDIDIQEFLVNKRIANLDIFGNLVFRDIDIIRGGTTISDRPPLIEMQLIVIKPAFAQICEEHKKEHQERERDDCE